MARPKVKTSIATLKMTPEVRRLWELAAERESRTLSNMFEVLVLRHCHGAGIASEAVSPPKQIPSGSKKT